MIVRRLGDVAGGPLDVAWGNGQSRRFLTAADNLGFSLTDTIVAAGTNSLMEYSRHMEACYCIEGEGELEDMSGNRYPITPGTLYALDRHEAHYLRAFTDMRLVCVFVPALLGHERHIFDSTEPSRY